MPHYVEERTSRTCAFTFTGDGIEELLLQVLNMETDPAVAALLKQCIMYVAGFHARDVLVPEGRRGRERCLVYIRS